MYKHNENANPAADSSPWAPLGNDQREPPSWCRPEGGERQKLWERYWALTGLYSLCPLWNQSLQPLVEVRKILLTWGHRWRPIAARDESRRKNLCSSGGIQVHLLETILIHLQAGGGSASLRRLQSLRLNRA